ncbi:MAG: hypothetical protein ACMXYF_04480 [Candidatus Woesearchaeota archaeon]
MYQGEQTGMSPFFRVQTHADPTHILTAHAITLFEQLRELTHGDFYDFLPVKQPKSFTEWKIHPVCAHDMLVASSSLEQQLRREILAGNTIQKPHLVQGVWVPADQLNYAFQTFARDLTQENGIRPRRIESALHHLSNPKVPYSVSGIPYH